ncbi:MAG: hypothetical protein GOVbin2056_66 [Prokaryotic dsDNA virus sp.]|nr:MAG: hypothetical protein GOVbin2056_66 [Prokaryotic dsDNA virus sp.]|tara:strand:+ start:9603 stop:11414 length:1812 start_codon:yes stop_codon:yes gene_type:complete
MAIQFLNTIDLAQNQLNNAAIQNVSADPASGVLGQLIFNTTAGVLKVCTTASTTAAVYSEVGGGVTDISSAAGTYISFPNFNQVTGSVNFGTVDLNATGTANSTTFLRGDNQWAVPPIDNYNKWVLRGDSGSDIDIESTDIVDFAGKSGTVISTATSGNSSPYLLEISHDNVTRTNSSSSSSPGYGGTVDVVDSITSSSEGHITAVNTLTITLPSAENFTFDVDGDSGTAQTIQSGDTFKVQGSVGIDTEAKSTDIVEVQLNLSELPTNVSPQNDGTDKIVGLYGASNNQATVDSDELTLNAWGAPSSDVSLGSQKLTNLADGSNPADAVNFQQLQNAVTGLLEFKGSLNANTGAITPSSGGGDLYTNVDVVKGDLYVVSVAGNFFGNAATPLTPGDSVYAIDDATAGNAVEADFVVVQSDTDLSTYTAPGLLSVQVQDNSSVQSGYHGSGSGAATGGSLNVEYANPSDGIAKISLKESSSSDLGIVTVAPGTGIAVSYSSGVATVSTSGNPSGVRISLDSSLSYVTKASAGGVTTFTIDVSDNSVFGGSTAAIDVKCEVITSSGQTVYADITRSASDLSVGFSELPSAPADGAYEVLLVLVA